MSSSSSSTRQQLALPNSTPLIAMTGVKEQVKLKYTTALQALGAKCVDEISTNVLVCIHDGATLSLKKFTAVLLGVPLRDTKWLESVIQKGHIPALKANRPPTHRFQRKKFCFSTQLSSQKNSEEYKKCVHALRAEIVEDVASADFLLCAPKDDPEYTHPLSIQIQKIFNELSGAL